MFIFTAKLDKRKAVMSLAGLAIVICVLVLIVGRMKTPDAPSLADKAPAAPNALRSNGDIVKYLASLGWTVDEIPLESADITIPREFTGQYADYAALQARQGLNLADYSGRQATRYTYRVLNYPTGDPDVVADVIICGGSLIAGDIQNPGLDGFMQGLIN